MNTYVRIARGVITSLAVLLLAMMVTGFGGPDANPFTCFVLAVGAQGIMELTIYSLAKPGRRLHDWLIKRLDKQSALLAATMALFFVTSVVVGAALYGTSFVVPAACLPKVLGPFTAWVCGMGAVFAKAIFCSLSNTPLLLLPWVFEKSKNAA